MKKVLLVLVLCVSALGLSGCETSKGATTGMALTVQGAAQDTGTLWGALVKLNKWVEKNTW